MRCGASERSGGERPWTGRSLPEIDLKRMGEREGEGAGRQEIGH